MKGVATCARGRTSARVEHAKREAHVVGQRWQPQQASAPANTTGEQPTDGSTAVSSLLPASANNKLPDDQITAATLVQQGIGDSRTATPAQANQITFV